MEYRVEVITPSIAAHYLEETNKSNRPIRPNLVTRLKEEIDAGRWQLNGEPIIFSEDRLLDGQHRLLAIVASGKTVRSLVVKKAPDESFSSIDAGLSRRPGDVLFAKGESHSTILGVACTWAMKYRAGECLKIQRESSTSVEKFLKDNPSIRESVEKCAELKIVHRGVAAACHYLFSKKDKKLADEFVSVISGRASGNESFHDFRERMISSVAGKNRLHPRIQFALAIKAWLLARGVKGDPAPLRFKASGRRKESFPEIV